MADEIATQEDTASMERVLALLSEGRIRELNDITDLCAEAMSALVKRQLSTGAARELRQWTELMFTCVQAQNSSSEGDVNFVTQLILMNTVEEAEVPEVEIVDMKTIAG